MEIIVAIIYYFKQIISANLDLFYVLALFFIISCFIKKQEIIVKTIILIIPLLIYSCIQIFVINNIDLIKLAVNIAKTYINIFLFIFIKEMWFNFNFKKFIKYICIIYGLSTFIGLIYKNQVLWRMDDNGNVYNTIRLKLFYYEPSELSFQIGIILIFLVFYMLYGNNKKERKNIMVYIICLCFILYLSSGMGGIICSFISCIIMYLIYSYRHKTLKQVMIDYLGLITLFLSMYFIINSNNSLYLRTMDIVTGNDSSTLYRYNIGYIVMKNALINTKGLGVGFGNLNTDISKNIYSHFGLVDVIANSFMYFVMEGGIFSIVFLILVLFYLFNKTYKSKSILKWGLLVYIIIYQIAGGYFTNPMNWIIYGIIASGLTDKYMINTLSNREALKQNEKFIGNN